MTSHIDWNYYRTALAVLEQGSLSGAARLLGLTQPTVGRQIEALEQQLGTSLFVRSQAGLSPTAAAQALRPYAEALRATESALLRTVAFEAESVHGSVRITASEIMAVEVLPPLLAKLRRAWPDLVPELVVSNQMQDLLKRDADIAVRMSVPMQEALIAKRIGNVGLGLYASQDYLAHYGMPADLASLAQHHLIGFDQGSPFVRSLAEKFPFWDRAKFALRTDNDLAHLAAIRCGYGIGVCQTNLARANPGLIQLLPQAFAMSLPVWLVMHEDLRGSMRYKIAFEQLALMLDGYVNQGDR